MTDTAEIRLATANLRKEIARGPSAFVVVGRRVKIYRIGLSSLTTMQNLVVLFLRLYAHV